MIGLLLTMLSTSVMAEPFTILHTNDWQSRLLGFAPNADYTPDVRFDDDTIGGIARLKTVMDASRGAAAVDPGGPVLVLDAGDWTMGTLFHTVTRERGTELQLMSMIGYDAVTIGNHEFDFRPEGLAQMIRSAQAGHGAPPIIATNLLMSASDARDDRLEALFEDESIVRSLVIERGGIRFGLLGVLGERAYEVMGQAEPVTISDPVAALSAQADVLRAAGVDVVILLSHSGVEPDGSGGYSGPEVDLLEALPQIDLIIGGHSHTPLHDPIMVDGRPIVQAGSDGRFVGRLTMDLSDAGVNMTSYFLQPVNDDWAADPQVTAFITETEDLVGQTTLASMGLSFDAPVAEVDRHLTREFEDQVLGNLVTDAFRTAIDADIAVTGNGTIRADVVPGKSGIQQVSDLFRISGLGIGTVDDSPGYALQKSYFTGPDVKSVLEFLLIGYQLKGRDYYPRISGAQVVFNNRRVPFDRIVEIRIGDDEEGYQPIDLTDPDTLYSVATTTYVGGFLPTVKETSFGVLDATPRDSEGNPVTDVSTLLYDADPRQSGVQEMKAWRAVLDRFGRFPDTDGDGLAELPTSGAIAAERLLRQDSFAPGMLYGNSTWRQKAASVFLLAVVGFPILLITWFVRRKRRA